MSDLWTVMWKEWKDLRSAGRSNWFLPIWIITIMGVVLPLSFRLSWIDLDPPAVLIMLYVPFMLIASFIGDAIAGERERHTLETLLASRISDRAILLGKILVTVLFTWGMTVFCLALGDVIVNLTQARSQWLFYGPASLFLVVLVLCLLTTLLAASGGVLISLKSATVRQASQTMVISEIGLGFLVYLVIRLLPPSLTASLTTSQIVDILLAALLVLDALLVAAALASFRRSRLIAS